MTGFDTVLVVDWSAGRAGPKQPKKDAIWMSVARGGVAEPGIYCRSRIEAEERIAALLEAEREAGRRVLAAFDFPFGYPAGFARHVTGSDDPFALWSWLEARVTDTPDGDNNRYEVAETLNALFDGPGPFWGKTDASRWPGIPYRKAGITFEQIAERRVCDKAAKAASSCFQLAFPPTVGGQVLTGLPVLARLRRKFDAAVWPFEKGGKADVVLAEIWPGLIESAVKPATGAGDIRDEVQVRLLARALSRLPADELGGWMSAHPPEAQEEGWILGAGHAERLTALAATDLRPPPLSNDCFALPPGVDWIPVEDALEHLRSSLRCVTDRVRLPLAQASGGILAKPIDAARAHPPYANAAVDGYGFAGPLPQGPHVLPLAPGRAAAGAPFTGVVPEGSALRILTGAALPAGVDTVVLEEDCRVDATHVAFNGPLKRGANARPEGEDVAQGARLLPEGRQLTPADLALLAATEVQEVEVRRRLRVAVLSTGDEVVDEGAGPSQIYDANRPMLTALLGRWGYDVVDLGIQPDARDAIRAAFDRGASEVDAILTSGGASAGDEDHVSALLRETGSMALWRLALKPGRPMALGLWGGVPVFGLPGNPVAALVCTLILARPALGLLAGRGWHVPQGVTVPAAFAKNKKAGRVEFLRARLTPDGAAEVFPSEGSGRISGLSWATGLVELGHAAAEITPGTAVRYHPFESFDR